MNKALIFSSAKLLPFKEPTSTDDGCLAVTQGSPITPALNRANLQVTDSDASKLAPAMERELSLSELAIVINQEHHLCQEAYRAYLLHACRTGEFLLKAKSKVKESTSGRWLMWLKENCPDIPERTARAYMEVAREWERIEKSATVADFGFKDALKFLSKSKEPKKPTTCFKSIDVTDTEWLPTYPSQELQLRCTSEETLKERTRVVVTEEHPLFAGQHGLITGRPSVNSAIVALDEGERERILIKQLQLEELKPQNLVSEPKSKEQQLLPSIEPNLDVPPNEPHPSPASLVNTAAIAHGKPDGVAAEIALGIGHLSPQQLAWVISAAADNGLSDAHLKAAVKAAKQALNHRYHTEYFKEKNRPQPCQTH